MDEKTFQQKLTDAVNARLRVIAGNEERLVEAWVAQHGWKPDETQIVRQDLQDGTMRMWVEKRGDFDELKRYREREPLVARLVDIVLCTDPLEQRYKTYDIMAMDAATILRDFKLSASEAEGAESA